MSFVSAADYLQSLTALVPYHNPQYPQVIPHMQNILNLCARRWVCDFLFNTDDTHLTILTAPFHLRAAVACSLTVNRFEPPVISNPYAFRFEGSIVFVPAHSVDHISVGFGMEEKAYSSTKILNCDAQCDISKSSPRHLDQFRYVRDNRTGSLVILYDYGEYYQFEYVTHLNTRCRQRSTSRFDRNTLLALLRTEAFLDEEKLRQAMICLQIADEFRNCPVCGNAPTTECSCALTLQSPKHSLDFSNHAAQMASHTGAFEGLLHLTRFGDGRPASQGILGTRITIEGGLSHDLVNRLSRAVISNSLQGRTQDPMASIFPQPAEAQEALEATSAPLLMQDSPSASAAIELALRNQDLLSLGTGAAAGGVTAETSRAALAGNRGSNSRQIFNTTTVITTTSQAFREGQAPHTSEPQATSAGPFRSQPLQQFYSQAPDAGPILNIVTSEPLEEEDRVEVQPLSATQLQQIEKQRERERKKELKKERNRASAQRSNLRKKLENDARKTELARLHVLEAELRAREQMLRAENVQLRRLRSLQESDGTEDL